MGRCKVICGTSAQFVEWCSQFFENVRQAAFTHCECLVFSYTASLSYQCALFVPAHPWIYPTPKIDWTSVFNSCLMCYFFRKAMYYLFNLIIPAIFIIATSCLVFYLPADGGEKVSLAVTVLLAVSVFLLMVAQSMPESSDSVPLLGEFIVLYCIVLYCIVLYCIPTHGGPVHAWELWFCAIAWWVYCIVLYCIVLYCIALHCIALYCFVLYCIVLYCIVLCCIVLYCIVL